MQYLQKTVIGAIVFVAIIIPTAATAQTSTSSLGAMLTEIQARQAQITSLQAQQRATIATLTRTIKQGLSGDDVTLLQALLASDPSIYPEGKITGFFGNLTAQAVKRFQKKNGLDQIGNVGPKTLKKLQELLKDNPVEVRDVEESNASSTEGVKMGRGENDNDHNKGVRTERVVCHKVPPGHMIAPGWLKKNDGVKPLVPDCQTLPRGILNILGKGTTTPPRPTSTTTPDTIAPVISALTTGSVTATSAVVTWTTNEVATSQAYVGTVNPATLASSTQVQVAGLSLAHSIALSSLSPSTTYYLIVVSTDASGNTTTSGQVSFTTTATPDTTAPAISAVTTSAIATTTATVSWATNEPATGNVYVGTVNPVVTASSTVVAVATSAMTQSATLSGLTASTTYFYVVTAKDVSNNIGTSVQQSFTTTN